MSVCNHSRIRAGNPEIPPAYPPETTLEPPLYVPPGQPVEVPATVPGET